MRVAIATRIFAPEPSAASFRLEALATALSEHGADVEVLTVRPPRALRAASAGSIPFRVSRFPVLRDTTGYVRGYLQYLSFDIPLLFRLLFGKPRDALVVEPPPTTWAVATLTSKIRRIPLFTYAADVWSDASESTGAPTFVVKVVRALERWALRQSSGVFAVNDGVADRVREICPDARVHVVGNGINTEIFAPTGTVQESGGIPYLIYTGTASEWQGAEVFIEALHELRTRGVNVRLVFLGQGTALPALSELAHSLDAPVTFVDTVPPEAAAAWIRGAVAGLASIKPGAGYDFAFPTKLYAAWATGTPTVYAGPGPVRKVLEDHPVLGIGTDHEPAHVADAIEQVLGRDHAQAAPKIAGWAAEHVSLASVASRATERIIEGVARG